MQTSSLLRAAFGAAFVLLAAPAVMAEVYQAEGMASLEAGPLAARQAAIEDALRQIAMTRQGGVQGSSEVNNGTVTAESLMLGPVSLPGKTQVISESRRDGLLFVTVQLDTDPPATPAEAASSTDKASAACQRSTLPPGRFLARRLVTTYFSVEQPQQASDLGNISTWFPSELVRRLNRQRDVQALDAGNVTLFPDGKVQDPWQATDAVRDVGRREGVQFVLAGRIIDNAITRNEPRATMFGNVNDMQQGVYYTGPFAGLLGLSVRQVPVERRLGVEYWLYDAISGGVLLRDVVNREARGDVHVDSARLFDTAVLAQTDYGRLIDQTLGGIADKVRDTMQCLPFTTRVARVEGDRVFLAAGALDGLAVRDRLLLYKPRPATEVRRLDGQVLGVPEQVIGDLEIEQVQPRFAVARLRNNRQQATAGDWVRFPVRPN
ncbi:flagellar assembly protein T N-terminal domain-containing protein [Vogesella oryzae]|uniref:flagellar assembly protein T N-terminal domain-containing protein n=1 Tax=Vogesella oryzae TaxID=1735285 RepID=UPI00158232D0|nr:flagellar assembly protein T N-terminal domain-containing protein [Vogesella oryzae]